MASGKRASMREGPLAALFRKTEEDAARAEADGEDARDARRRRRPSRPSRRRSRRSRRARSRTRRSPSAPTPEAAEAESRRPRSRRRRSACATRSPRRWTSPTASWTRPSPRRAPAASARARGASVRRDAFARPDTGRETPFGQAKPAGQPVLRVIGVGGGGSNAVNRMVEAEVNGVEFFAVNTDLQSLQQSLAHETLHIGAALTRGLGSGSNPELGRGAAMEEYDRIKAMLKGSDMVFITAGAGGGTGTGAAPGHRADRAGARRADGRHRHEAVRLRGHAPPRAGRGRHRRRSRTRSTR